MVIVTDIFDFTNEIHELKINEGEILVSYDVSSLFTNVPLDETIEILVNRALRDSANKLVVPFPRTNYMKNSFSCSGATLWNSLHRNIRESSSIDQFKRLLYQNF